MAGAGIKNFGSEILTSNDVDQYLMQQTVMTFASSAARTTAFTAAGLSPSTGMVSYLTGTNELQVYTGAAWESAYNSSTTLSLRTGGTDRLTIDASGRVRMPFQPVASVYRTSSLAAGNNIGWTGSYVNVGNMYPGSGGVNFTVPVAGNYLFCFQAMSDNNAASIYVDLYQNGNRVPYLRAYAYSSAAGHKHYSFQIVLAASANDYFYFRNEGTTLYGDSAGYSNALVMLVS